MIIPFCFLSCREWSPPCCTVVGGDGCQYDNPKPGRGDPEGCGTEVWSASLCQDSRRGSRYFAYHGSFNSIMYKGNEISKTMLYTTYNEKFRNIYKIKND